MTCSLILRGSSNLKLSVYRRLAAAAPLFHAFLRYRHRGVRRHDTAYLHRELCSSRRYQLRGVLKYLMGRVYRVNLLAFAY